MIDIVIIPVDPAAPARVERLPGWDVAGLQRLVGGYVDLAPVDDELWLASRRGAALRGFPTNPRACLLAVSRDPDFGGAALCGDVVALGPPDGDDVTAAPAWLCDLCTPGRFQVVDVTAGLDAAERLPFVFSDPFLGLAVLAGLTVGFPDQRFRLARVPKPESER